MPDSISFSPSTTNLSSYAKSVLEAFNNPVACERMDALLYMTVGAERMRLVHNLCRTMRRELGIGQGELSGGIFFGSVLGAFGAGKSHIGYLLKHDALTCGDELLVSHVQITSEPDFPCILAAWLRNLRLAGMQSMEGNGIEISAYYRLLEWVGHDLERLSQIVRGNLGNLHPAMVNDFVQALALVGRAVPQPEGVQQFIDHWVKQNSPREALEVFEAILRCFRFLRSDRMLLILDEFEAVNARSEQLQKEILQHIQDMHDDFAGRQPMLPRVFLLMLSTPQWWDAGSRLLPSLLGQSQRVRRVATIPNIERIDVAALLYRYLGLYQLAFDNVRAVGSQDLEQLTEEVWGEVAAHASQLRLIHQSIRQNLERVLGLTASAGQGFE